MSQVKVTSKVWMWILLLVGGVLLWSVASSVWACPACKDAVEQSVNGGTGATGGGANAGGPSGLAKGFFWSILLMLGVVYAMLGVAVFVIVRSIRKTQRARAEQPATFNTGSVAVSES